jgi:acyl-CoA synthetase (AMP-forming)/AMP-acid ligase II
MFVELRDEQGNVVPQGEVGEIHIGGTTIIREYFNNPEATADARRGGFFTLGDMGRFDEEGYLYIVDRKKDMIISGGENIFPNDIEEILYRHTACELVSLMCHGPFRDLLASSRPSTARGAIILDDLHKLVVQRSHFMLRSDLESVERFPSHPSLPLE